LAISIPDWGVTSFAKDKDAGDIADSIDSHNSTASLLAAKYNVAWLDITTDYRKMGGEAEMLVGDGLHPSAKVYELWGSGVRDFIIKKI
jgi:lysophospholipase L1-like esterase